MKAIQQTLVYLKSTKRTHVFRAVQDDAPVTVLYVNKDAFPSGHVPMEVSLNLEQAADLASVVSA